MIQHDVVTYLNSQTDITNVVGDRIYPVHISQVVGAENHLSAISIVRWTYPITDLTSHPSKRAKTRMQIDVWSPSLLEAQTVSGSLSSLLDGFHGTIGDTYVGECFLENQEELWEQNDDGSDNGTFHIVNDFLFFHQL